MTKKTRVFWTPVMLQLLREWYPQYPGVVVAGALDIPLNTVYRKANQLGLEKSKGFLESDRSGRIQRAQQSAAMVATRFQKGLVPWNKGLHVVAGGRSAETRFKPGQRPHTWKPIGSERVVDGYLQRKVTESGYPPRDWVPVHVLLWREHHGDVPEGHAVRFKNGNKADIRIDNLELLSRAQLLALNSFHNNYPPELKQLVHLKAAIKRQVNRRVRESKESTK